MKNEKKYENLKKFTSEYQPSPEAKSRGWERRREAQRIMDMVGRLSQITLKEMEDLLEDIKTHPERHSVLENKMARYVLKEKFTTDYLDRHISKAPQEIDVTSAGDKIEGIRVEIVNPRDNDTEPKTN